ncbi:MULTISPECIES: Spx/MgsR family RNA polymerase-binding regulatory protein [Enterococcus]|uniref:Arsenate reductase n=1 Tax=Candidatus Enterococcus ferrettii TaxID=2815324 RepID=A0ABV0ETH8_9ENTE|nr:arsenate reductase family protein [Enterococcus sp. 665A]
MYKFYEYAKCSTCKKAKAWLTQQDVDFEVIDLITQTPSAEELEVLIEASDLPLRRFFNTSGMKYRELNLKDQINDLTIQEASRILSSDGMLIKRPMIVKDGKFLINGFNEDVYEGVFK